MEERDEVLFILTTTLAFIYSLTFQVNQLALINNQPTKRGNIKLHFKEASSECNFFFAYWPAASCDKAEMSSATSPRSEALAPSHSQGTGKPESLLACRKIHLTPFSSRECTVYTTTF